MSLGTVLRCSRTIHCLCIVGTSSFILCVLRYVDMSNSFLCGSSLQYCSRPWLLWSGESRCSRFENSCLVPGNVLNGGAELRNMIQSDSRDASDNWLLNHIRSVIFSAMVRLVDCRLCLLLD